jgi:tetratricopeptide (TPR) repeat protein
MPAEQGGYNEGMWSLTTAFLLLFVQNTDPASDGVKALEARNYEQAAQLLTKAVAADPKDYVSRFNLSFAQSMLGKDDEAVEGYKKVLDLKPGLYAADLNLGILLLGEKRAAEALPHLQAATEAKPKEPRPRLYLSAALLETGDAAKAEQSYKTTLELDPKSTPGELGLAEAIAKQGRLADAEPHFRRAVELDPSRKDGLLSLADLYEKAGQNAEAIAIYQGFPDNVAVREHLGQMLVNAGRASDGIPHLEWAVKQSPTSANRLALAQAYRKNKEPDKELPILEQAVREAPQDFDLRMAYGRELRDQHRYAEAAREFAAVAQAKPDSLPAWNELSAMLTSLENYPQAIAVLDRIKALGGETNGHLYLRAIILDRIKDQKGALEYYEKFLAGSDGKHPDEEFKARQRARILKVELSKR